MADVRRCRRCKRKRMDDEPPEVRQYKTCAKCRIIERQKKKLRKPLAEETMLYGMKQFQQQNQNLNFSHDDIFMDDDMFTKKKFDSNLNPNLNNQYQYHYTYLNNGASGGGAPGSGSPIGGAAGTDGLVDNYDSSRLTGNATASTIPQTSSNNFHLQNLHYQQIAQRALPMQSTNLPKSNNLLNVNNNDFGASDVPVYCDICETKLDLSDDYSVNYKLCLNCYSNPFKLYNVYEDYNKFLIKVLKNKSESINNIIFLKEMDKNFIDNLNSYNKVVSSEHEFREFLLENLKKIFIEPLIATTGYEFQLSSTNLNELSKKPPVIDHNNQYNYNQTHPIKVYYKCLAEAKNTINCHSNLFLDFNLFNNYLKIKFNHKIHNFFLTYPMKFMGVIYDVKKGLEESTTDEEEKAKLGFNQYTGELVYNKLVNELLETTSDEEIKTIIEGIPKAEFIKDFPHAQEIIDKNETKLINKQYGEDTTNGNDNDNVNNKENMSHDIDSEIVSKLNLANNQDGDMSLSEAMNLESMDDTGDKSSESDHEAAPKESIPEPEQSPQKTPNDSIDKILDPAFEG